MSQPADASRPANNRRPVVASPNGGGTASVADSVITRYNSNAIVMILLGYIATVIGLEISAVIDSSFWFGGVAAIVSGFLRIAVHKYGPNSCLTISSVVALAVAIICALVVAYYSYSSYNIITQLDACASADGVFGDETDDFGGLFEHSAKSCHMQHEDYDCSCIIEAVEDQCYLYNMAKNTSNCNPLLKTSFGYMILTSCWSLALLLCFILNELVSMCWSGCLCPNDGANNDANSPRRRPANYELV